MLEAEVPTARADPALAAVDPTEITATDEE